MDSGPGCSPPLPSGKPALGCVQTDRWSFRVFQSTPDLIRALSLGLLEVLVESLPGFQGTDDQPPSLTTYI